METMKLKLEIEMDVPDSMQATEFGQMFEEIKGVCKRYSSRFRIRRMVSNKTGTNYHVGSTSSTGTGSERSEP